VDVKPVTGGQDQFDRLSTLLANGGSLYQGEADPLALLRESLPPRIKRRTAHSIFLAESFYRLPTLFVTGDQFGPKLPPLRLPRLVSHATTMCRTFRPGQWCSQDAYVAVRPDKRRRDGWVPDQLLPPNVVQIAKKLDGLIALLDATADGLAAEWDLQRDRISPESDLDVGDDFTPTIQ
jgi:hypothetical protein